MRTLKKLVVTVFVLYEAFCLAAATFNLGGGDWWWIWLASTFLPGLPYGIYRQVRYHRRRARRCKEGSIRSDSLIEDLLGLLLILLSSMPVLLALVCTQEKIAHNSERWATYLFDSDGRVVGDPVKGKFRKAISHSIRGQLREDAVSCLDLRFATLDNQEVKALLVFSWRCEEGKISSILSKRPGGITTKMVEEALKVSLQKQVKRFKAAEVKSARKEIEKAARITSLSEEGIVIQAIGVVFLE
ncbi:hypothetical protein OAO01_08770 [Oligoflexia bacterium]|nr:hypothetical protein [Oligoflexia bacterium]